MHIENLILNTLMSLALPLIIIGFFGIMAGVKPNVAFKPLTIASVGIIKLLFMAIGWLFERLAAFSGATNSSDKYTVGYGRRNGRQ